MSWSGFSRTQRFLEGTGTQCSLKSELRLFWRLSIVNHTTQPDSPSIPKIPCGQYITLFTRPELPHPTRYPSITKDFQIPQRWLVIPNRSGFLTPFKNLIGNSRVMQPQTHSCQALWRHRKSFIPVLQKLVVFANIQDINGMCPFCELKWYLVGSRSFFLSLSDLSSPNVSIVLSVSIVDDDSYHVIHSLGSVVILSVSWVSVGLLSCCRSWPFALSRMVSILHNLHYTSTVFLSGSWASIISGRCHQSRRSRLSYFQ
jgi:hypothetical protein